MDVSFMGEDNFCLSYVSCIAVDGIPILAPVMTDAKRAEMRNYRAIAVEREKCRLKKKSEFVNVRSEVIGASIDDNIENTPLVEKQQLQLINLDDDFMELDKSEIITNPKTRQLILGSMKSQSSKDSDSDSSNAPESASSKELHEVDGNIIRKSKVQVSNLEDFETDSDEEGGGGHFASLGSSTGTFIIQNERKSEPTQTLKEYFQSSDEGENSNKENEVCLLDLSPTRNSPNSKTSLTTFIPCNEAILFGERESSYKRKRPASYFDSDNLSIVSRTLSTTPDTESTSLQKYISAVNSHVSNATITPTDLDRLSANKTFSPTPLKETFTVDRSSHVINTDFVSAAAALSQNKDALNQSEDFTPLTSTVRRKNIFDSPSPRRLNSARESAEKEIKYPDTQSNTSITSSSFENSPPERLALSSDRKLETLDSDNSDKENRSFKKKHVRKLSYTLLTPSAALLAASSQGIGPIPLAPLMSEPSSVATSVNATPEKAFRGFNTEAPTPITQEMDSRVENLDHAMFKLQQLNLGKGKKIHLERYLGDQRMLENQVSQCEDNETRRSVTEEQNTELDDLEVRFKKLQEQHKNQLEKLSEMHRQQQIKMEQQFLEEKERLIEELTSQKSSIKSDNTTTSINATCMVKDEELINLFSNDSRSSSIAKESPTKYKMNDALTIVGSGISPQIHPSNASNPAVTTPNSSVRPTSRSIMYPFERSFSSNIQGQHIEESPPIVSSNSVMFPNKVLQSLSNTNPMLLTPIPEPLGYTGLSKLQSRMHALSPNCFKSPVDSRSPLLKGLIYLDPLNKPKGPIKIPLKVSDPLMKLKFEKVTAAVKGYLTRRLLHSEKIQLIIQTIRDTVALVLRLHEEAPDGHAATFTVKPQDSDLHKRLLQQLSGACSSFHNVFFKLSTSERMAIIATDREKLKAKALRNVTATGSSANKRNISVATLKCLERRISTNRSAVKKDSPTFKKVRSSISNNCGSQSVKPKVVASYKISPKRRRMSFWDRDQMINNRVTKPGRLSTANWKPTSTTRKSTSFSLHSSRSDNSLSFKSTNNSGNLRSSRSNQDTFIVSSNRSRPPTGLSRQEPVSFDRSAPKVPWKTRDNVNRDSIDRKW